MSALKLLYDLKKRYVRLAADGDNLKVDAPAGALTDEDRVALMECKLILLEFLSRAAEPKPQRSEARWAGLGWIRILDPDADEWHEVPASMCLPGVVAETEMHRRHGKGGAV